MQLVNEFTVDAPVATAWAALTDIPRMARCIPGAQIDSQDGDDFHGRVGVKVGPVGLTLLGTATLLSRDDDTHRMVVKGLARDHKGQGSAEATITMTVHDDGGRSAVKVTTDLDLAGRIAQFGSGVISQVSGRIIKQFVNRLDAMIMEQRTGAAAHAGIQGPAFAPTAATTPRPPQRGERSDLISLGLTALAGIALGLALGRMRHCRT